VAELQQALTPYPEEAKVPVGIAVNVDAAPGTQRIS